MRYYEIRVELEEYPERFNRLLLIREDLNLFEVGVVIGVALKAEFEHLFMFRSEDKIYVDDSSLEMSRKAYKMSDYLLTDLPDNFDFLYDTGEDYIFNCDVQEILDDDPFDNNDIAYLLDGKGQGIWEDNKYSLISYLDGIIKTDVDDEENGFHLPWNFKNKKYSDFDKYSVKRNFKNFSNKCEKTINELLGNDENNEFTQFDGNLKILDDYFTNRKEVLDKELPHSLLVDKHQLIDEYNRLNKLYGRERATWILFDEISLLIDELEEKKNYH